VHDTEYASPADHTEDLQSSAPVFHGSHDTAPRGAGQTPPATLRSATTAVEVKKKARLAIASTRVTLCHYLSRLLESYGFDVVSTGPLTEQFLGSLQLNPHDVLLIDCNEDTEFPSKQLETLLVNWEEPVLINDSIATEISLQHGDPEFGNQLAERINLLLGEQVTTSISSRQY
jgi:hypothetical protein